MSVAPLRDWTNAAVLAEKAAKKGSDALLLGKTSEAYDHYCEVNRQIAFVLFWITTEGGK